MKQLQLVTYQCDFEKSIAGVFISDQLISKEMVAENTRLMVKEQFPELSIDVFNDCTEIQEGDVKSNTVSLNVFMSLNNIREKFFRWEDEWLDKLIEWEAEQKEKGKVFDVFEWMLSKGIIEKAEYQEIYIPHSGE